MGYFKVKAKNNLDSLKIGDVINESDYSTLTPSGNFVQLEYVEEEEKTEEYKVKPGVWSIQKTHFGLTLSPTSFTNDAILDSFIHTKNINDKIDCFFRNLHVYKDYGIEIPKRAILLYGPPGTGKSSTINKVIQKYTKDNKTCVVVWHTSKFESHDVKDFIKRFKYEGVERVMLIVEDIGGVEMSEVRRPSDSGLLSLLDNQEKTFTLPVLIIATTNFPETFLGNLTNRPQRFDDKIKVGFPPAEMRVALMEFFSKRKVIPEIKEFLLSVKGEDFTPAHLKEVVIRSAIYEKDMLTIVKEIAEEIEVYKKGFSDKKNVGF